MEKTLERIMADLPVKRKAAVEARAVKLATLKELRQTAWQTQHDLATNQVEEPRYASG